MTEVASTENIIYRLFYKGAIKKVKASATWYLSG